MIKTYAKILTIYRLSSLVKWDIYKCLIKISANNHAINATFKLKLYAKSVTSNIFQKIVYGI